MGQTYNITGRTGLLGSIVRIAIVAAAAIGGLFMLAASAAFAFFIIAGLSILGFIAVSFFWARAKITGKPFGPRAQFEAARKDMEAQMRAAQTGEAGRSRDLGEGPIIDAHETPDGWSVDD